MRLARLLLLVGLVAAASPGFAHPGWGIVRDPQRDLIYYTDLTRVWRIDGTGERTVAVPGVHTHELRIDGEGNLYGEDLQGVAGGGWRYRVWRLSTAGSIEDVIPWTAGFRDDYGFVPDSGGALYWASCVNREGGCVVKRRMPDGRVEVAAGGAAFERPLNFLASDSRGGVLLADGPDLKRITAAGVELVAADLARDRGRFAVMGLHAAGDGSIYATAFEDRTIVRLGRDGSRSVVARSSPPWQPAGVLAAGDALWVVEYDRARVQVRRIGPGERVRVYE
jgi:hypothetical protein